MKKYFNYYGQATDEGEWHTVQNGKVTTYEKRSMFRTAKVKHEQPLSRDTAFAHVMVHDLGPDGKGGCELTTGSISHQFYVANGIEDFINEVRREMGASPVNIKPGIGIKIS